jgi:hypothetical protein
MAAVLVLSRQHQTLYLHSKTRFWGSKQGRFSASRRAGSRSRVLCHTGVLHVFCPSNGGLTILRVLHSLEEPQIVKESDQLLAWLHTSLICTLFGSPHTPFKPPQAWHRVKSMCASSIMLMLVSMASWDLAWFAVNELGVKVKPRPLVRA